MSKRAVVQARGSGSGEATPSRTVLDDRALALGTKIRERRRALGLSLVRLAEITDLSHPFLSQVERGHARPSVTSLQRIAEALDVDVGTLFAAEDGRRASSRVVRAKEAESVAVLTGQASGTGHVLRANGWRAWVADVTGLADRFGTLASARGELIVFVVDGEIEVDIDDDLHLLAAGDALFVDASHPGRMRSTGGPTRLVMFRADSAVPNTNHA
jgi:transcriptional regulator with XRE-family HTH domain